MLHLNEVAATEENVHTVSVTEQKNDTVITAEEQHLNVVATTDQQHCHVDSVQNNSLIIAESNIASEFSGMNLSIIINIFLYFTLV